VSRAYYGAFHLARDFVESCGVMLPKTAEAHDKLQWCLAQVRSQSDFAEMGRVRSDSGSENNGWRLIPSTG
jgi:hypothetical protein